MGQSADLLLALKRELRARRLTYAMLAAKMGMAESTVKRMFARGNLNLSRLEAICEFAEIDYGSLVRGRVNDEKLVTSLTVEQEGELIDDSKLFLVAVCLMNLLSFDEILEIYALTAPEVIGCMTRLDRIGFVRLLPHNRYRLLLARTFSWVPNGPIQQSFKANAPSFFNSDFGGSDEMLVFLNARLTPEHLSGFLDRLKRVARDFSDQHSEDSVYAHQLRRPVSLLIAARPWHMEFMDELLRTPAESASPSLAKTKRDVPPKKSTR